MSASSRSTIFSIRSKKSKDSGELTTTAGPAYESLPMSPRPPISVPTIIPPSQHPSGRDSTRSRIFVSTDDATGFDDNMDNYSIRSEQRNGHGPSRGGSISGSITGGGGVSGPRPFPPRSGSAEKVHESSSGWSKYNPLGHPVDLASPNVLSCGLPVLIYKKLHKKRASSDHGSLKSRASNISNATSNSLSRAMSPPPMLGDNPRLSTRDIRLTGRASIYSFLSVTPSGEVHLDRPKDDKIIDQLFNDLMVPPPP